MPFLPCSRKPSLCQYYKHMPYILTKVLQHCFVSIARFLIHMGFSFAQKTNFNLFILHEQLVVLASFVKYLILSPLTGIATTLIHKVSIQMRVYSIAVLDQSHFNYCSFRAILDSQYGKNCFYSFSSWLYFTLHSFL